MTDRDLPPQERAAYTEMLNKQNRLAGSPALAKQTWDWASTALSDEERGRLWGELDNPAAHDGAFLRLIDRHEVSRGQIRPALSANEFRRLLSDAASGYDAANQRIAATPTETIESWKTQNLENQ